MKLSHVHSRGAILLSILALDVNLHAQSAANPSGATAQQHPHLLRELGLSPAQKAEIKQIRETTPKGKERREEVAALLTPEQKAQLKQEIADDKAHQD